jgi:hypothetical protein
LFAAADTCVDCFAYNDTIMAACGILPSSLTYDCNTSTAQCTAYQSSAGMYPSYTKCKAECGQQFRCVNNTCVVSPGGVSKTSCGAICG